MLLWSTTIYGPLKTNVKPTSLGYGPNCFLYIELHGQCPCVNNQSQLDWLLSNHYNKRYPYTLSDFTRCWVISLAQWTWTDELHSHFVVVNALVAISLVIKMWVQCLAPEFLNIQDFDAKLQILQQWMQKQVVTILQPFLSFMLFFQ